MLIIRNDFVVHIVAVGMDRLATIPYFGERVHALLSRIAPSTRGRS